MAIRQVDGDLDIVPGSITSISVAPYGITGASLATGAVTSDKLAVGSIDGSSIVAYSIPSTALSTGAVTANAIVGGAVTNSKLGSNSIDITKMGPYSVGTTQLATGAVTANQLGSLSVINTKIMTGAVGTPQMATGSVTRSIIAATAVGTSQMGLLSVTNAILATGAARDNIGYTGVNQAGDTMTGVLTLATGPTNPLDAATKGYVDTKSAAMDIDANILMGGATGGVNITYWGMKAARTMSLGAAAVGECLVTGASVSVVSANVNGTPVSSFTFATGATGATVVASGLPTIMATGDVLTLVSDASLFAVAISGIMITIPATATLL